MKKSILFLTLFLLTVKLTLAQQDSARTMNDSVATDRMVLISTDYGDMKVKLYNATPQHRDNFIKLVAAGFYDSLLFHRVIKGFMIQGGDPESKHAPAGQMLGNGDVGYTIPAEFVDSLFHKKGALCAARTENPEKASSGCQFYIVQGQAYTPEQMNMMEMQRRMKIGEAQKVVYSTIGGTPFLDHNYTVFGEVVEGLDVIDKIAAVQTAPGDRPVQDVRMKMKVIQ
ncbi:MAG TPA: peptidylprolyl isomerase [Bacteroidia bacterium]|nr:peptidylprolyl isomerase [Bacteroidia bacterium]HNQ00283.1 peptidylprolyl isomerase [Bacteroidia bacterium]